MLPAGLGAFMSVASRCTHHYLFALVALPAAVELLLLVVDQH